MAVKATVNGHPTAVDDIPAEYIEGRATLSDEQKQGLSDFLNRLKADPKVQQQLAERDEEYSSNGHATHTAARERINRLRLTRGPLIETRIIEGEPWYIRRLDWPGITRLGLMIGRDGWGHINVLDEDCVRSVTIAMLSCCVASGEDDPTSYFTQAEAMEFVDEPGALDIVQGLFMAVRDVNPGIMDEKKGTAELPTNLTDSHSSDGTTNTEPLAGLPIESTD